jgi:hypothetical protein
MSTATQLQSLLPDPWIGHLAQDLLDLHSSLGAPEPGVGPAQTTPAPYSRASIEDVGDWDGEEQTAANTFNTGVEALFYAIDIRAVSGGQYHTTWAEREPADPTWHEFSEQAEELIKSWLADRAWDEFCNDPYGIGETQ